MSAFGIRRAGAAAALVGGVLAVVGNLLHPRFNGDDVVVYRQIAGSDRYTVADVVIVVTFLLIIVAFLAIARSTSRSSDMLGYYGRLAAVIGGAIALVQIGVETYGFKQQARSFASADSHNIVSAFWATNAIDHLNAALFDIGTIVFLGLAPALIGAAQWRGRRAGARVGIAGLVGGAVCFVVGFVSLLKSDQSSMDVPFLVGSLLVTAWIIASGVVMWRAPAEPVLDLTETATGAPTAVAP